MSSSDPSRPSSPEPAAPAPGSRSARFRYRRWFAVGVGILLALIALLPWLVSSRWVYEPMLKRMQAGDFRFSVDAVDLHWFRPIRLRGVTIAHSGTDVVTGLNRPPLVQVDQVGTDRGLLGYLFSGRELGKLELVSPVIDFELLQEDGGFAELLRAIGGEADERAARPRRQRSPLNVAVAIRDARVVVRHADHAAPLIVVPPFDLDVAYRAGEEAAWVHVEPTRLLDHVALTPELMQLGMEYVVPVLARSAWLSGDVSVDLGAINIPLDRPLAATGTADVTFHSVRAGLSEPALEAGLRRIALLLGRTPNTEVVLADGTVVEVVLIDSVVQHQGMKLGLPRIDPRLQLTSEGSVGLVDRSLDLVLSIPIPLDLVARRESVRELGVPMVRLPIGGVIGSPELQWSQLRGDSGGVVAAVGGQIAEDAPLSGAIIGALGGVASGEADEAIRAGARALMELRQRAQQRRSTAAAVDPAEADGAEPDGTEPDTPQDLTQGDLQGEDDQQVSPQRRPGLLDRIRSRRRGGAE